MQVILRNTQRIIIHVNIDFQFFVILRINECMENLEEQPTETFL